ncbi:MAG: DNA gyrase inhibitor YacG [Alphaproteobacteria bacterium]|nr:DNA gyrase inhibitor YacG [Alphaproteobacteria bacterium]NCQ66486.1 DNA gyrase inhibitor YacG [Alphaproteobacteria bacterium]
MIDTEASKKELPQKCALCKKKAIRAYRPFCSKRCKDIDLGNWFTGKYVIVGDEEHEKQEAGEIIPLKDE